MFALLSSAFVTLFVVLDPPGLAPVFIALTSGMAPPLKRTIALEAALVAFAILVGALLFGQSILAMLGYQPRRLSYRRRVAAVRHRLRNGF